MSSNTVLVTLVASLTFSVVARSATLSVVLFFLNHPTALTFFVLLLCLFVPANDGHACSQVDASGRLIACYPDPECKYVGRLCQLADRRRQLRQLRHRLEPVIGSLIKVIQDVVYGTRSWILFLFRFMREGAPILASAAVSIIRLAFTSAETRRVALEIGAAGLLGYILRHALVHEIMLIFVATGAGWIYRKLLWEYVMNSSPVMSYIKCRQEETELESCRIFQRAYHLRMKKEKEPKVDNQARPAVSAVDPPAQLADASRALVPRTAFCSSDKARNGENRAIKIQNSPDTSLSPTTLITPSTSITSPTTSTLATSIHSADDSKCEHLGDIAKPTAPASFIEAKPKGTEKAKKRSVMGKATPKGHSGPDISHKAPMSFATRSPVNDVVPCRQDIAPSVPSSAVNSLPRVSLSGTSNTPASSLTDSAAVNAVLPVQHPIASTPKGVQDTQAPLKPVHKYRYGELVLQAEPASKSSRCGGVQKSVTAFEAVSPGLQASTSLSDVTAPLASLAPTDLHTPTTCPALHASNSPTDLNMVAHTPIPAMAAPALPTPTTTFDPYPGDLTALAQILALTSIISSLRNGRPRLTRPTVKHVLSPSSSHFKASLAVRMYAPVRRLRVGDATLSAQKAQANLKNKHAATKTKLAERSMRALSAAPVQLPVMSTEPSVFASAQSHQLAVHELSTSVPAPIRLEDECDDMEESNDEDFMEHMLQMIESAVPMDFEYTELAPAGTSPEHSSSGREQSPVPWSSGNSEELATNGTFALGDEPSLPIQPSLVLSSPVDESSEPAAEASPPDVAIPAPTPEPPAPIVKSSTSEGEPPAYVAKTSAPEIAWLGEHAAADQREHRCVKRDRDGVAEVDQAETRRVRRRVGPPVVDGLVVNGTTALVNQPVPPIRATATLFSAAAEALSPSAQSPAQVTEAPVPVIAQPVECKEPEQPEQSRSKRDGDGISEIEQVLGRRTRRRTVPSVITIAGELAANVEPSVPAAENTAPGVVAPMVVPVTPVISTAAIPPPQADIAPELAEVLPAIIPRPQEMPRLPTKPPIGALATRPYYIQPTAPTLRPAGYTGPSWTTAGDRRAAPSVAPRPISTTMVGGWSPKTGKYTPVAVPQPAGLSSTDAAGPSRTGVVSSPDPFLAALGLKTGPTMIDRSTGYAPRE